MSFDPNAPSKPSEFFGLPFTLEESHTIVVPVPFDATTSFRQGTCHGPAAVLAASGQVDLFDLEYGKIYERGLAMLPLHEGMAQEIEHLNEQAHVAAAPIRKAEEEGQSDHPELSEAMAEVNVLSAKMNDLVEAEVGKWMDQGKFVALLGGDHSVPFGAIRAVAKRHPGVGILHIDAHADLRVAYEGFTYSHASIMENVLSKIGAKGGVASLVQVGIRDFCEAEYAMIQAAPANHGVAITTHFDLRLQEDKMNGAPFCRLADEIVSALPAKVYLSLDIDGLDPALCPDTGTPVPGGLSLHELWEIVRALRRAGKRLVGLDVNEVAPARHLAPEDWCDDWNANVGARVLYRLIGAATTSR